MTPNNRLPEHIYVRRRVAAVVVLLVVIGVLIWIMTAFGGSKSSDEPVGAAAVSESAAANPADPANPSSAPTGDIAATSAAAPSTNPAAASESAQAAPSTSAAPKKETCSLDDLIITANSDKPTYNSTELPKFYMTVKNPTGADCDIDLGQNVLRFEVYNLATNQRVWSDVDCNAPEDTRHRIFPASSERYYEAQWSRTTSAPKQCKDRVAVPPGSYYVHTLVGNNHSDAHTFNLG